ncbi:MAG: transposase [Treponema sp.]|jgi:hypothetical protein|nr:transposase [Treponema sp.]
MKRILAQGVWYEVRTAVNNREPLFRLYGASALCFRVLREAKGLFAFEIREIRLEDERLSFYIKPARGFQLPQILQWIKQTFAVRFNVRTGRSGHIWGDRYWSRIVAGEPPEWAEVEAESEMQVPAAKRRLPSRVSPRKAGKRAKLLFLPHLPLHSTSPPG